MSRTRAVITASVLLSALAFGGCSDDEPQPKFAPPSSEAPTSAGTPTATTSSPTPSAGPADPEDAVAAWFVAFSDAMVTGDTSSVRRLSSPDCTSCDALADQVESIYSKGGSLKTAGWSVETIRLNGELDESPNYLLRVKQASRTLLDGERVIDRTPMTKVPMSVEVTRDTGEWQVRRLVVPK